MSEEQRFRWAERLFWDLNFLPQMGQSGTPGGGEGGGGGAGALSSLSSKHLQRGIILTLSMSTSPNASSFYTNHPGVDKSISQNGNNINIRTC